MDVALAVTRFPESSREARIEAARKEALITLRTPFDLGKGPLLRARLFVLGPNDHALVLCMHHIISDGWSMGVLNKELGTLYAAFRSGRLGMTSGSRATSCSVMGGGGGSSGRPGGRGCTSIRSSSTSGVASMPVAGWAL